MISLNDLQILLFILGFAVVCLSFIICFLISDLIKLNRELDELHEHIMHVEYRVDSLCERYYNLLRGKKK